MQGLWKRLMTGAFRPRASRLVASPSGSGSATLYSALCDAMARQGRGYRVLEDMRRVEYRYQDLLKMVLMLTRLVERAAPLSEAGSSIGLLLPNVAPTVALIFGLSARGRTPAMLNYTAGADALIAACRSVSRPSPSTRYWTKRHCCGLTGVVCVLRGPTSTESLSSRSRRWRSGLTGELLKSSRMRFDISRLGGPVDFEA